MTQPPWHHILYPCLPVCVYARTFSCTLYNVYIHKSSAYELISCLRKTTKTGTCNKSTTTSRRELKLQSNWTIEIDLGLFGRPGFRSIPWCRSETARKLPTSISAHYHRPIHNNYQTIIRSRVSKKRKKTYKHFCWLVLEKHFLVSCCIGALCLANFVQNVLDYFIFANCRTISKLYQRLIFFPNCCTTGEHNFFMFWFFVFFCPCVCSLPAHYRIKRFEPAT